ncbi:immunoglobulin superfamily DCC subclass member 3-like [Platysternon megacephalum]|nr:immunoglobulin superfamily DCC subclass member 3-like [Platysternon megacephalum]
MRRTLGFRAVGPSQCQQEISISVPECSDTQQPLNLTESFAELSWYDALAGTWVRIAVIHSGKSNPLNSSFARHISVSNGWFIVTNASKAIAGNLKIVHDINKSECLASIHLNVTEPAPTSAPPSLARDDRLNGTAAGGE